MKTRIVIIGGMGPQANIELHRRIIKKAATLGARNGDDFPEVMNISIPIADFISSQATLMQARDEVIRRLERLYPRWRQNSYSL